MKAFWVSTSDLLLLAYTLFDGSHKPVRRLTLAVKPLDPADWYSIKDLRAFRMLDPPCCWAKGSATYLYKASGCHLRLLLRIH